MAENKAFSPIDFFETFLTRTAYALLVVSVGYFSEVLEPYVSGTATVVIKVVQLGVVAILAVTILPLFITWVRKCKGKGGEFEGFVAEAFRKACAKAFEITFLFLIALEILTQSVLADLPAKTVIDLTLGVSLATGGITFWLLNRQMDDDEGEADDEGPQ